METLASPATPDAGIGRQTVEDLKRLLRAIGADEDLLRRVLLRADIGDRLYISVPPLPVDLLAELARLRPGEVPPC